MEISPHFSRFLAFNRQGPFLNRLSGAFFPLNAAPGQPQPGSEQQQSSRFGGSRGILRALVIAAQGQICIGDVLADVTTEQEQIIKFLIKGLTTGAAVNQYVYGGVNERRMAE